MKESGFGWRYEGEFNSETSFEITDSPNKELIMILNHLQSSETNFFVIIPTSNLRRTSICYYKELGGIAMIHVFVLLMLTINLLFIMDIDTLKVIWLSII